MDEFNNEEFVDTTYSTIVDESSDDEIVVESANEEIINEHFVDAS